MAYQDDQLSAALVGAAIPSDSTADMPFWMLAMSEVSTSTMMANTARRGSNTIMYGGRRRGLWGMGGPKVFQPTGQPTRAIVENMNPFRRFTSQDIFFNDPKARGLKGYTPFNMAGWGNTFVNAMAGQSTTKIGSWMGKLGKGTEWQANLSSSLDANGNYFSQGSLSKIMGGSRVARMGGPRLAKALAEDAPRGNLLSYLRQSGINTNLITNPGAAWSTREAASYATFATGGRAGGFIGAARHGLVMGTPQYNTAMQIASANAANAGGVIHGPATSSRLTASAMGTQMASRWASQVGLEAGYTARQALGRAVTHGTRTVLGTSAGRAASGKLAAKALGLAGARVAGVAAGPVGWAISAPLLAYDVAKLGAYGIGKLGSFASEGFQSLTRGARTGILQQRFTDNEVTATSRSRGVSAISASRLNARSILGNEAAAMASHFG